MAKYLRKFATIAEFDNAKVQGTLDCPNTALIMADGSVKYTPNLIKENIGIRGANGVCYTLTEWNALATADKPTPVGVYVYDDANGRGFVIHNTTYGGSWSIPGNVLIDGCTTAATIDAARQDFAGKENTDAVLYALSQGLLTEAISFTWARGLDFIDPNLEGYIPSYGELQLIMDNRTEIDELRNIIGHSALPYDNQIFSSTQESANRAWRCISDGGGGAIDKFNIRAYIAIAAI